MTPAEHYAEAEKLIELIHKTLYENAEKVDIETQMNVAWMGALLNGHATLATVNPDVLWPKQWVMSGAEMKKGCTCPRLGASPIARTSTDPACPIHGEPR